MRPGRRMGVTLAAAGCFLATVGHADPPSAERPAPPRPAHTARLAIVIDDVGFRMKPFYDLLDIEAPLTFAVLPFSPHGEDAAKVIAFRKRELIVHMPMEPTDYPESDPGPNSLLTWLSEKALRDRMAAALDKYPAAVGVNNHMGSRFTQDERRMRIVLSVLQERGLYFLDSRTTPDTVGYDLAREMRLPAAVRTRFLDADPSERATQREFNRLIRHARAHSVAIGIGHPYPTTVRVLARELPRLDRYGVTLAPLSDVVRPARAPQTVAPSSPPARSSAPPASSTARHAPAH